jgi:hypothetical protein
MTDDKAIVQHDMLVQYNTGMVDFQFGHYNAEMARLFPCYQFGWEMEALRDRDRKNQDRVSIMEIHDLES